MSAGSIGQQIINGTYGLDNRPPTAYEELKAWCEKHLAPEDYKDVPATEEFFHCIYFSVEDDSIGFIAFFGNGSVVGLGSAPIDRMNAHIEEHKEEAER